MVITKKEIVEDLVKICKDSYNLMLQGSFPGAISDDVSNHLKTCLAVLEACTYNPADLGDDSHRTNYKLQKESKDVE